MNTRRKKNRKQELAKVKRKLIRKNKEEYFEKSREIVEMNKRLENWDYGKRY